MKFLFVLQYPGYTRYFDSVIRLLIDRGHRVAIAYDSPEKQAEGNEAFEGVAVEMVGETAERRSVWASVGRSVRGTIDYVRYLDPRFAETTYLRDRMRKALPPVAKPLGWFNTLGTGPTNALLTMLHTCERAIPSSGDIERFLKKHQPDVLVVSPLVTDQSTQVDVVKSAQSLGIPNALCVASWDHLTTKGLVRLPPELITVWNEHQREEALAYHRVPAERIVVTGAPPFDRWFDRKPRLNREAFCREVGLRSDQPFILFVGSTKSISRPDAEQVFVRQWLETLRAELATRQLQAGLLVRPHPFNSAHWLQADLTGLENVAIYPRHTANPVNERDRDDYFDSLYHSAAVVGINTSAMIEAAIVGRTVHTVLEPAFTLTQEGTLHFRYLLPENGGFLRVATSLKEHVAQLADTLANPSADRSALGAFVRAFVRPHGLTEAATPRLADALEALAHAPRQRRSVPIHLYPLTAVLCFGGCVAAFLHPRQFRKSLKMGLHRWRKRRAIKRTPGSTKPPQPNQS